MISAGAVGAATGVIGIGLSAIDIIRGERMRKENEKNLKNLKRPMMEVTQGQQQQVELGRQMANQDMPGYQLAQQQMGLNMQQSFGNASRAATNSNDLLSFATQGMESQQGALANLAMQNAQSRRQGMLNYQDQLGGLGETQQEMFMMNKFNPFQEKRQQYQQNMQQGGELVRQGMAGIGGVVGGATPMMSAGFGDDSWEKFRAMYGATK